MYTGWIHLYIYRCTCGVNGGTAVRRNQRRDEGGAHASTDESGTIPNSSGRDARHHGCSTTEVGIMKTINQTTKRAVVSIATTVALVSTVGAPFKWSMMRFLPPIF